MHEPPVLALTVKPRKGKPKPPLPIIVYDPARGILSEVTEKRYPPSDIFALVATCEPSLIAAQGVAGLLYDLDEKFRDTPGWQFACHPLEETRYSANNQRTYIQCRDLLVTFLGFQGAPMPDGPRGGKRRQPNRYHATLDPVTFCRRGIQELVKSNGDALMDLYLWAANVRQWCQNQGLSLRPTSGGVAGQMLRDQRFYPAARRKVPSATNATARGQLPGNHYRLYEREETPVDAYYLDQVSSHHSCARDITFPHANYLHAVGSFRTLQGKGMGSGLSISLLDRAYGLFLLSIDVPHLPPGSFPPPWAEKQGKHDVYIFSNELPLLRRLKCKVETVIAAWISPTKDSGLNTYAKWALAETAKTNPADKAWKKPLLLATYGILASTPHKQRTGFAQASRGERTYYPVRADYLPVTEVVSSKESEPAYANVIHRGMIEAETRLRSLTLAHDMHRQGHRIVAVYADSIFVHAVNPEDDSNMPLPIPPPGWTVQACLTRLRFHDAVSFTSDQMQKLPGIPSRDAVLRASAGGRYYRGPWGVREASNGQPPYDPAILQGVNTLNPGKGNDGPP